MFCVSYCIFCVLPYVNSRSKCCAFCCDQNACRPHPEIHMLKFQCPTVMVFGSGAFGKWLDHEGGILMNEINALMKEVQEEYIVPSTTWRRSKKSTICNPEEGLHQNLTNLPNQNLEAIIQKYWQDSVFTNLTSL